MLPLLRYVCHTVGTLEVPDEVSLIYTLSGCPLRCPGCHSADLRNPDMGRPLDPATLASTLDRYAGLASCVCFLGGEWQPELLIELLKIARARGFATCLYTGREAIDDAIARMSDMSSVSSSSTAPVTESSQSVTATSGSTALMSTV